MKLPSLFFLTQLIAFVVCFIFIHLYSITLINFKIFVNCMFN